MQCAMHLQWAWVWNDHFFLWSVAWICWLLFDLFNNVHAFNNFAEYNVTAIQPWCHYGGNEELWSIGVFASIGHRQKTRLVVLQWEVFIFKTITVDWFSIRNNNKITIYKYAKKREREWIRLPAGSISIGEITALDHEFFDDTMEFAAFVTVYKKIKLTLST